MQQLNILISHASLYKKAGWGRIFPLAVGLVKNGHKVTILTTNQKQSFFIKRIIIKDVRVIVMPEILPSRVSRMGFGFLSLFLKVIHVLFNKYDIVHSDNGHRPLAGIPCRVNKRIYSSVYVAEWYDWYGKGGQYDNKKKLFKLLLGRYELKQEVKDKQFADGVVVLSEVLRERAMQFKPKNRVVKIHGGADVSSIPFVNDNRLLKVKYNIGQDVLTFGYINSESYRKAEFMPLVNTIVNNGLKSKVKILLFGECQLLINQLPPDIIDLFVFFGWIDFSKDYEKLQCVDVFFSFKEEILGNKAGWPNCIGDYLACGRPVLVNPVGEVVDFAKKYPFAFIETSREENAILDNITYIMANINVIKEAGTLIRKLAEDEVSWEKKSNDLLAFYLYLRAIKKNKE